MEKQEVTLWVKSRQEIDGEEQKVAELMTNGTLYQKDGKTYITYDETEATGTQGTKTTLKAEENRVTLIRFGKVNSQMVFEKGKVHEFHYETPEGKLLMGADCKALLTEAKNDSGRIAVSYLLSLSRQEIGMTHFEVRYQRETGPQVRAD